MTVTVQGMTSGEIVTIPSSGAVNQSLFEAVASVINQSFANTKLTEAQGLTIPAVGDSVVVAVSVGGGAVTIPAAYSALLFTNNSQVLTISAAAGQNVLSGTGGIVYTGSSDTVGSAGTSSVAAGGGNNRITFDVNTKAVVSLGDGNDTVFTSGTGLIDVGLGKNVVGVNGGTTTVFASGSSDTLVSGSGNTTLASGGANTTFYTGSGKSVIASGGSNATVISGTGATTVFAGKDSINFLDRSSSPIFLAGENASTTVVGGAVPVTIFGATGANVTYFNTANAAAAAMVAGAGSETLNASGSTVGNAMYAGTKNSSVLMLGGSGDDVIVGGAGAGTLTGGAGADLFMFAKGIAGGSFTITDFTKGSDTLLITGYGTTELASALSSATTTNSATTVSLTDGTKITFANLSSVDTTVFKSN